MDRYNGGFPISPRARWFRGLGMVRDFLCLRVWQDLLHIKSSEVMSGLVD